MTPTYEIRYTDGSKTLEMDTLAEATAHLEEQYPDGVIGHDGDLSEGGDRTLVWADEASSVNDPGANAVAEIREAR